MKTGFIFQIWPYAALALFGAGLAIRYAFSPRKTTTRALELAEASDLFGGGRLLQISLVMLFVGHLAGLLFPHKILLWNSVPSRLYTLEGLAFALGLSALAGWSGLMWRHLGRSGGSIPRQVADAVFLSLLFAAILSGLLTAILYRWGSSWGVLILTPYGLSLLRGDAAVRLAAEMPFLVQLHVFSGFVALAILPLTRMAPILVAAMVRGLDVITKPASVAVAWARRMVEAGLRRHDPAVWIWPEED